MRSGCLKGNNKERLLWGRPIKGRWHVHVMCASGVPLPGDGDALITFQDLVLLPARHLQPLPEGILGEKIEWLLQMLERNQLSGRFTAWEHLTGRERDRCCGKDKHGMGTRPVPGKVAKSPGPTFVGIPVLRGSRLDVCLSGFLLFRTPGYPGLYQVRALLLPTFVEKLPWASLCWFPWACKGEATLRGLSGPWGAECQMLNSKEALGLGHLPSVPSPTTCCVTVGTLPELSALQSAHLWNYICLTKHWSLELE